MELQRNGFVLCPDIPNDHSTLLWFANEKYIAPEPPLARKIDYIFF